MESSEFNFAVSKQAAKTERAFQFIIILFGKSTKKYPTREQMANPNSLGCNQDYGFSFKPKMEEILFKNRSGQAWG
eukprot:TRINITY_DN554_c0_g2_i1.p1 TRINITY_DN554_c0_g2~~TRINITY_DN554_c0_g2_i1.p1  ORF type:complete len:76 (-),score=9.91 TRINITY_DN554_c0_g2_i1:163-390(-)